ncbi:MAG: MFS transporter [Dehalococcoidia bacterium]
MSSGLTDRPPAAAEAASTGTATTTNGRPAAAMGGAAMGGRRPPRGGEPLPESAFPPPSRNWFTRIRTFQSIGYLGYRNFFLAMLGQMASQNMQMVVRAWLTFELTGSYAALGVIALANAIPGLVLSMLGGAIADRVSSRKLIIQIGQVANALNTAGVGVLLVTDLLTFEYLFAAAVIQGITMAIMMPSRQSLIPGLVPGSVMMNAVALNAAGMNSMRLIAPAIGGFVLAYSGASAVYFLMSSLYLLACVFLWRVPELPREIVKAGSVRGEVSAAWNNMGSGIAYIVRDPILGPLLLINVLVVLTAMPYMFLLAGFVQDVLNAEADALGTLQSVSGIGSLAAALAVASMTAKRRGAWFLIGSGFQGLMLLAAFSLSTSVWMMGGFMLLMGIGQAARQGLSNVLVQEYVQEEYRGRVMSVYMLQFSLSQIGAFLTGLLAEAFGPRMALGSTSAALVVLAFGALIFVPRLRNLD